MLSYLKLRSAKMICQPWIGARIATIGRGFISRKGYTFDTRSIAIDDRIRAMLWWGFYESAEARFIERYLPSSLDVIELGGSLGYVSCRIARRLDAKNRLVSVEANPQLVTLLRDNVSRNAPDCTFEVVHAAIDYTGRPKAFLDVSGSSVESHLWSGPRVEGLTEVRAITLTALLGRFDFGDYALVSDIEGAEAGMILHDPTGLARCQMMIIELHDTHFDGCEVSVLDLKQRLLDLGFRLEDEHGPVCIFKRHQASRAA